VGTEDGEDIRAAREGALAFVAGKPVADIAALAEEIYDEEMAQRIWSGTHALAKMHLDAGQRVWLVTAAPVDLASLIAQRLGLTGALGTVAEVADALSTPPLPAQTLPRPPHPQP